MSINQYWLAGAAAGLTVDLVLFPIDTIKTRLQSGTGFVQSGGARRLYTGLSSALFAAAPSAGIFFTTYETLKLMTPEKRKHNPPIHALNSSVAAVAACTVWVPFEVIKQRMQVGMYQSSFIRATTQIFRENGPFGFYRGFQATIQREIPFAIIQFPCYEFLKSRLGDSPDGWKSAACGSAAGGAAGFVTTPLDVVKTRTILSNRLEMTAFIDIYRQGGMAALFAGALPRTLLISIGGFVFFGMYEQTSALLKNKS